MSIKRMTAVWEHSQHKGSALLLLLAMADNADDQGYCWPGIEYLATKIRMTAQSVINITTTLEDSGELYAQHNRRHGNRYLVTTAMTPDEIKLGLQKLGLSGEELETITQKIICKVRFSSEVKPDFSSEIKHALQEPSCIRQGSVNTVDANAPTPILSEDEAGAREFEELFGTGAPTALECVVIAPFTARDLQTEEGRERAQAHLLRSRRLTVENEPWQIWGHCPTLSEYSPPVEISRTFVLQAISLLMQAGVPLDLQKKSEVRFWISSVESIGRKCGWEIGVVEQALARALQAGLSIKGPQSIDYAIADIMVKAQQAQNGGVIAGGDGGMITAIRKVTD